jgi:hypothetical protein
MAANAIIALPTKEIFLWRIDGLDSNKRALLTTLASLLAIVVLSCSVIALSLAHNQLGVVMPTPTPSTNNQVTILLSASGTISQTAVGTNIQTSTEIAPASGQPAQTVLDLLQNWNQPMLRLHFGFRGENVITLPEATQGSWDFSRIDPVIATLRARHISFFMDVRTAPPWMFDSLGQLPDQNFSLFATYMARLVGWYNKGGFTDDNGVYHASGHENWIHVWEIWNEPKSAADIPVAGVNRKVPIWMQPDRYARLYDMTVDAMRAVDPTIVTGGPALGSFADANNFWIDGFVRDEHAPLDFLSFHFYAGMGPTQPDAQLFDTTTGARFLDRLVANRKLLDQVHPGKHIPIWITELNIDESSLLPLDPRGTAPIEYSFLADALITAEYQGVGLVDQFNIVSGAQLGLIDNKTYQFYRPAWFYQQFSQLFPPGSTLLPEPADQHMALRVMAMITPDHKFLRLLVGNIQVANPTDVNGTGVVKHVTISLTGSAAGASVNSNTSATVWRFDAQSPVQQMPNAQTISLSSSGGGTTLHLDLPGYGTAMVSIPLS